MISNEGLRSVYYGFTSRMKAGDQNTRGAVPRTMGQQRTDVNNLDKTATEALELVQEAIRRKRMLECDIVRIGNVIRRRRRREVAE
jgi:hypothetical protein